MLESILIYSIVFVVFTFNKIFTLPFELMTMSPIICDSSSPSEFTGGACYDTKHILILILSAVTLILILRITLLCESIYHSCNCFGNSPNAEISVRMRFLIIVGHHLPALLMIVDIYGTRRVVML